GRHPGPSRHPRRQPRAVQGRAGRCRGRCGSAPGDASAAPRGAADASPGAEPQRPRHLPARPWTALGCRRGCRLGPGCRP
ncbi:hypothetical protein C6A85_08595, partial [Mycobacterium sp. ITM-2017-0098]